MLDTKEVSTAAPAAARSAQKYAQTAALVDDIMRQSDLAIRAGSALPIDPDALAAIGDKLRPEVTAHLGTRDVETATQLWIDDSVNVIKAATILGTVATCVARLHRQPVVDQESLDIAFALVQKECNGQFGAEGCWCGC